MPSLTISILRRVRLDPLVLALCCFRGKSIWGQILPVFHVIPFSNMSAEAAAFATRIPKHTPAVPQDRVSGAGGASRPVFD